MNPPESSEAKMRDADDRYSRDPGIVREFASFLRHHKKWWLAPILIVTVLMMGMVFLAASPVAPFIYALF
ncbi:hypothetical protein Poly51_09020 [Rubripirellula tenax]|uniref:Uncharacterized protein n=1 Tax=Rubripirellula tenax TaxID=2528015 RepID=A0A5C6FJ73_9BACT|nr:DUF5989 family protein [Rubripirellula tenax]TWU60623.1 hypothetical protein Poly51_09020 [Rubripirellula tenax]